MRMIYGGRRAEMAECISREDVLDNSNIITVHTKEYGSIDVIPVDTIADIELADVQPVKHGRWIEHINRRYDYDREQGDIGAGVSYTCSLCDLHGFKAWHFCPNCGARMDGEQNVDKEV